MGGVSARPLLPPNTPAGAAQRSAAASARCQWVRIPALFGLMRPNWKHRKRLPLLRVAAMGRVEVADGWRALELEAPLRQARSASRKKKCLLFLTYFI